MKNLLKFDEILTKKLTSGIEHLFVQVDEPGNYAVCSCRQEACAEPGHWRQVSFGLAAVAGHDTSLFRRLVLGWIEADFRVQIRIFQHFSKSTRKSSSREQILQISVKKLENFAKILTFFGKFCKFLYNF